MGVRTLERIKGCRLNWEPDSRFEYHSTSAHWMLVEVITRKTGLDFRDYIRQRITQPMGVPDLFVGLPDEMHGRAADIEYLIPVDPAQSAAEQNSETILHFNLPSQRRSGAPGAGGFAGAGELALFYQRLVSPQESGAHAVDIDQEFEQHPVVSEEAPCGAHGLSDPGDERGDAERDEHEPAHELQREVRRTHQMTVVASQAGHAQREGSRDRADPAHRSSHM